MPIWSRHSLPVLLSCILMPSCTSGRESRSPADSSANEAAPATAEAAAATPSPGAPAPLTSNANGCAPGSRCISVTSSGSPLATGLYVAQCRGKFADFLVRKTTLPPNYSGPWFRPELIENATTSGPAATRPWLNFNPGVAADRMKYLIALRNYAFTSRDLRSLTPLLTTDATYRDPLGGGVDQSLRNQKWYPAPRMLYLNPGNPREAAYGMTTERTVDVGELAGNTVSFRNYAVAYYDARGANAYRQAWSTATPGRDVANSAAMHMPEGSLVYKVLFSAAKPTDFPQDILQNAVAVSILPNAGGTPVPVRLLQIDIAVKDNRAGTTGWYFATFAYDRNSASTSPWRRMVPVGLMWGNDPAGPPLTQTWINPNAPQYARNHLGVDGRLNGPVDNKLSACMSCHSTAQAPSVAPMLPTQGCNVAPYRANWYRNLPGSQAFGRFTPTSGGCTTTPPANAPTAADYSLQLGSTVSRSLGSTTSNPCTWDTSNPPAAPAAAPAPASANVAPVFAVTRDP